MPVELQEMLPGLARKNSSGLRFAYMEDSRDAIFSSTSTVEPSHCSNRVCRDLGSAIEFYTKTLRVASGYVSIARGTSILFNHVGHVVIVSCPEKVRGIAALAIGFISYWVSHIAGMTCHKWIWINTSLQKQGNPCRPEHLCRDSPNAVSILVFGSSPRPAGVETTGSVHVGPKHFNVLAGENRKWLTIVPRHVTSLRSCVQSRMQRLVRCCGSFYFTGDSYAHQ